MAIISCRAELSLRQDPSSFGCGGPRPKGRDDIEKLRGPIWDASTCGGGIARGWRCVIFFLGRAEEFREDWFQSARPDLVALERGMQLVVIHHAFKKFAVAIRQFVID